jgi:predicted ATPase
LNVDNLKESDVSALVADALGVLPRRCKSLAQRVHSKTKGNPFFAVQVSKSVIFCSLLNDCCVC